MRRALALLVVVFALGSAWVWSGRHAESLLGAARATAKDAVRLAATTGATQVLELADRVQKQAASFAALKGVEDLVKSVDLHDQRSLHQFTQTLADVVQTEPWTERWRALGAIAVVLDGKLAYASSGDLSLGPEVEALLGEAETTSSARGILDRSEGTLLAGVARVAATTSQQGRAAVVLLTRLTPEQLAPIAGKLGATVSVLGSTVEASSGDPAQVARLKAFVTDGAPEGEACCAMVPLAAGVRFAAWLDPTWTLRPAEAAASRDRLLALGVGALLAAVALVLGFRPQAPEAHSQLLQETTAELKRSREELKRLSQLVQMPGTAPPARSAEPALDQTAASVSPSRYVEVAPLGEGGMAKVVVAEVRGAEGFKRHFVVKRLRRELSTNPEIVNQFIDEARLGASLVHSNIVPVFDFGRDAEGYFLAQEYILGRDVDALVETSKARRSGRALEPELALYVAQEALKALSYAHGRSDEGGRPLRLVHRDVSPNNLMVSARGEVKLLDFGIVKSDQRLTHTQTGVVKGNLYFMSPEQARALEVDARSDLFSLGMVLYTAVTGRTLYSGNTTFELINRAGLGPTGEDRRQVASLPGPLGPIIAPALEIDPQRRYRDAEAFARAVAASGSIGTALALQKLMESLFHDELGAESGRLTRVTR